MAYQTYQLELVYGCNLSCQYCTTKQSPIQIMPLQVALDIIDSLPQTKYLYLQGHGEPSLHPDFELLAKYAKDTGKFRQVCTVTNGIKKFNYSLFDRVNFSCDSVTETTSGKYVNRIRNRIYNAKASGIEIQIWSVNYGQDLEELKEFCKRMHFFHYIQNLNTNATLAYKYDIDKPKYSSNSFECSYVKRGLLQRFLVDGTPVDCCWCRVEHKELFKDIDLLHNNLRKGIVTGPCVDCMYLGAIK